MLEAMSLSGRRLHAGSRLVVPFVLLLAATGKILAWSSSSLSLLKLAPVLGLAPSAARGLAWALPPMEAALGLGILLGFGRLFDMCAWLALGAGVVFVAVRGRLALAGIRFTCPCFRELMPTERPGAVGMIAALGLLAGSFVLATRGDPLRDQTASALDNAACDPGRLLRKTRQGRQS